MAFEGPFSFAPHALERFRNWRITLKRLLRGDELPKPLGNHLAKYGKLLPALALVTHLAEWRTEAVTLAALEKAIHWAAYRARMRSQERKAQDEILKRAESEFRILG
jgi:hypothetical protein